MQQKGGLTATSYNIYRNKQLIATVDGTTNTYTDKDMADGEYHYNVTAVYDEGESSLSNEAVIAINGIEEKVSTGKVAVAHYSVDGRRISATSKGMHIVRFSDGSTRKVVVE